ncbi:MAG: MinD/ParA family protein [Gudongella sp.]|nr:MinD/ParA family protein [Gudongella sp.]
MIDQASKLRDIITTPESKNETLHQPIVYSVVSGKGGVGKTNFSVNLAIKLFEQGKKVLIMDADIGMSNVNIVLGVEVKHDLFYALHNGGNFEEVVVKSPYGPDLLSGGAEFFHLESLDYQSQQHILKELKLLEEYDIVIIDNGAGISKQSLAFTILADEIILITTPEPTAITDAYRVLKMISLYKLKNRVKIVVNQVQDKVSGDESFEKLSKTANEFLKLKLDSLGYIFSDIRVNKSIMEQEPLVIKYPNAVASQNIENIAESLLNEDSIELNISAIKQFGNRILRIFG